MLLISEKASITLNYPIISLNWSNYPLIDINYPLQINPLAQSFPKGIILGGSVYPEVLGAIMGISFLAKYIVGSCTVYALLLTKRGV